jgi:hypothetical protein
LPSLLLLLLLLYLLRLPFLLLLLLLSLPQLRQLRIGTWPLIDSCSIICTFLSSISTACHLGTGRCCRWLHRAVAATAQGCCLLLSIVACLS